MRQFTLEKTIPIRLMMMDNDINKVEVKNYELTFSLATEAGNHPDIFAAQLDQNISFSKITYFLQNVVDESFVYRHGSNEELRRQLFATFANNFMIVPDLNESMLATILHTKLNSIACEYSNVDRVVLKDNELQLSYDYVCTDIGEASNLPSVADWMGDMSYWPNARWLRNDPTTYDFAACNQTELEDWKATQAGGVEANAHAEAFDQMEHELRALFKRQAGEEMGEVIEVDFNEPRPVRQKWVPQVVE